MTSPKTDITIRALEPGDAPAFIRIHNDAEVVQELLAAPFTSISERAATIANSLGKRYLVAEVDGEIAATGLLHLFSGRRAHAAQVQIAVHPDYESGNVRSVLLTAILDLGERWFGVRRFELQVFRDSPLTAFYEQFGFQIEATHREYAMRDGAFADTHTMARYR